MLTNFADRLFTRVKSIDSRLCVGIDPDLKLFPVKLLARHGLDASRYYEMSSAVSACLIDFGQEVLEATRDLACAVKFQSAHFELYGQYGIYALDYLCRKAKEYDLPVILDAKRNDIGSTASRYAQAYLGPDQGPNPAAFACDALTVTPFLGVDGIAPFVEQCAQNGKGLFVLVKTSNPSGAQIQDLEIADSGGKTVAERLAVLVNEWGSDPKLIGHCGYSCIGAVIGATKPESVPTLRRLMPRAPILMPGFGAQGGKAPNVGDAFDSDGLGAIVNSSRGIIYPCAPDDPDYFDKVKENAKDAKLRIAFAAAGIV